MIRNILTVVEVLQGDTKEIFQMVEKEKKCDIEKKIYTIRR